MSDRDEIPRMLRERLDDPVAVCASLGLLDKSKRQSGGVMIRCPAHQETSPSCSVTRGRDQTLRWRCFACSASGDVFTLLATVYGLDVKRDFVRVLEAGASIAGIPIDLTSGKPSPAPPPPRSKPIVEDPEPMSADEFAAMVAPLERVGRLDGSGTSTECTAYLEGRGLIDAARIDGWFAISPDAGGMLCSLFGQARSEASGLVDRNGRLRWPNNTLCIPWRTPAGIVQTIQRRNLGECDAKHRYVFPTGRGPAYPYGIDRLRPGPVYLVEGAADVLAKRKLDDLGWSSILGVPGVSGWRSSWDAIVDGRIVTIAFDKDDAGNREGVKLGDRLWKAGAASVRRATPKLGKDWADAMRRSA